MTDFNDCFKNKLVVGGHPYGINDFDFNKYDYIINVSDEYRPYRPDNSFWFPMNECTQDIGINSMYGALTILNRAFERNLTVYLHCHAGVNRSRTVWCAFYYMKTGKHINAEWTPHKNVLIRNCFYGHLPPIDKTEKFLFELNNMFNHEKYNFGLDTLKLKHLKIE